MYKNHNPPPTRTAKRRGFYSIALAGFLIITGSPYTVAQVVQTNQSQQFAFGSTGYQSSIPSTDVNLLAFPTTVASRSDWDRLKNGSFGTVPGAGGGSAEAVQINSNNAITYTFETPFLITEAHVFTGWGDNGRVHPNVSVQYATEEAPEAYITIQNINYTPAGVNSTWVKLSNINVVAKKIRFSFGTQQNGYVGYLELAVLGQNPEPTAEILSMDFGALGTASIGPVVDNEAAVSLSVPYGTAVDDLAPDLVLSYGATSNPPSGTSLDFTSPQQYTVTSSDSQIINTYTVTVVEDSPEALMTAMDFGALGAATIGSLSGSTAQVTIYVPMETDVTSLAPTYTTSFGASGNPTSGTPQNFTNPVVYTITSDDEEVVNQYTVTVTKVLPPSLVWDSSPSYYTERDETTFQTGDSVANFNLGATASGTVTWGEDWTNAQANGTNGVKASVGGITLAVDGMNGSNSGVYSGGTQVLDSSWYNWVGPSASAMYVTLSGFDLAKEYKLQFLVVESRSNLTNRESMMRVLGGGNDSPVATPLGATDVSDFAMISCTLVGHSSISIQPLLRSGGSTSWNMGQLNAIRIVEVNTAPTTTTTTLASSVNPSTEAQEVIFTATVNVDGSPETAATGTMVFRVDGDIVATENIADGQATYTTSTLLAGSRAISATYSGDETYAGSVGNLNQVVEEGLQNPYDEWAGENGYNLVGGPGDDDDGDGMSNFQEYAFGLNPISGASVNPITDVSQLTDGIFSYTRRENSGLTYSIWYSGNLEQWHHAGGADQSETVSEPGVGVETVTVELPNPLFPAVGTTKLFIRVKAE